ncbi:MAG: FAD-dependent oxidoreductase [Pseudomonadota bacterium]
MSKGTVAIIGGGPGGISAARYLKSQGFAPTVFESHSDLGGQWNLENPNSGVWPSMRTNTSGFVTKLSDVQYPDTVKIFPRNGEVLEMLRNAVRVNQLETCFRFDAQVTGLEKQDDGYRVSWVSDGRQHSETFDRAVIATGRFIKPEIPDVAGLESFTGKGGVLHSHRYKDPFALRDMNIVVLGGSISSMEVASDQSMMGRGQVYMSQRRQRYVMPKMFAGVPLEFYAFTLENAFAIDELSEQELLAGAKEFLELQGGNPARYDAPAPDPDMAKAGVTGSQHYLNLVAEDRIDVRPWVKEIAGDRVTFEDGSTVQADAIVIGTGFDLHLPFLSEDIARTINLTDKSLDLCEFTFHPDLPGLAFVGLWAQLGPYPVVLEQQARWIAYCWGGTQAEPTETELREGVEACRREQHHIGYREQHEMAVRFARLAGTMPDPGDDQELAMILPKCPITGETFRISGIDADPKAADWVKRNFWFYAALPLKREIGAALGLDEDGSPLGT